MVYLEVRYCHDLAYCAYLFRWKNVFENLKRCPHLLEDSELFRTVPEETKQPVAARNNLYTHLSGVGETHEASQGNEDSGDSASDHVGSNEKSTRTQPYLKVLISDDPLAQLIGRWHTERLRSELEVCDYITRKLSKFALQTLTLCYEGLLCNLFRYIQYLATRGTR